MKKYVFSSNLSKNKYFFKILKTDVDLNYLAKFMEQFFSKPHLDASETTKITFFSEVNKVENFKINQYLNTREIIGIQIQTIILIWYLYT
jgi:hypothetical protein